MSTDSSKQITMQCLNETCYQLSLIISLNNMEKKKILIQPEFTVVKVCSVGHVGKSLEK